MKKYHHWMYHFLNDMAMRIIGAEHYCVEDVVFELLSLYCYRRGWKTPLVKTQYVMAKRFVTRHDDWFLHHEPNN